MKVAIYCRLSEEDKNKQYETDDSASIANQKAMLAEYGFRQTASGVQSTHKGCRGSQV